MRLLLLGSVPTAVLCRLSPHALHGEALSGDVGVDVEVEADADPLEEVVVQRDEADLDGNLEVLQTPQLLQEVGDLLVDLLRLADHQAQVRFEGGNGARPADGVPGGGSDRGSDQVDEAVEVGLGAAAESARPGADGLVLGAGGGRPGVRAGGHLGQHVGVEHGAGGVGFAVAAGHHGHGRGLRRAEGRDAAETAHVGHRAVVRALQAHLRRHEVGDRHHQVGHVIGHPVHLSVAHLLAGDLQHLILDHVAQVERLEDQVQRALEHDLVAQLDRDRRIAGDALFGQPLRIEVQVDLGQFGQVFQHFAQRGIGELERDRRAELLVDFDLALGALAPMIGQVLGAALGEFLPLFGVAEHQRVLVAGKRDVRFVHFAQRLDEHVFLLIRDGLGVLEPADEPRLPKDLHDDRVVGVQFVGLFGDDLRLVVTLLVHELVELVDQQGQLLANLDFRPLLPLDFLLHVGVLLGQLELRAVLLDELLVLGDGAVDAAQQLIAGRTVQPGQTRPSSAPLRAWPGRPSDRCSTGRGPKPLCGPTR